MWQHTDVFHVGDVIRKLRTAKKWSLDELADASGVNRMTISGIERGATNYQRDTLDKLARALGFPSGSVLHAFTGKAAPAVNDGSDVDDAAFDIGRGYKPADIPVLGPAEATRDGIVSWDDGGVVRGEVEEWISRPGKVSDQRAYGLRVRGDSMIPRYLPGETIIASPSAFLKSGHYACVQFRSGERLIKQVFRQEDGWNLISLNQAYPPRFVRDDEIAAIHKIVHNSHEA